MSLKVGRVGPSGSVRTNMCDPAIELWLTIRDLARPGMLSSIDCASAALGHGPMKTNIIAPEDLYNNQSYLFT